MAAQCNFCNYVDCLRVKKLKKIKTISLSLVFFLSTSFVSDRQQPERPNIMSRQSKGCGGGGGGLSRHIVFGVDPIGVGVGVLFHFCALSNEPDNGFGPNLHRYIVGRMGRVDQILLTLTLFQGHRCTLKIPKF